MLKKFFNRFKKKKEDSKIIENKEEVASTEEAVDYTTMTLTELKEVAKIKGVKGYSKMKKEELINALN